MQILIVGPDLILGNVRWLCPVVILIIIAATAAIAFYSLSVILSGGSGVLSLIEMPESEFVLSMRVAESLRLATVLGSISGLPSEASYPEVDAGRCCHAVGTGPCL